jgi:plastocyanin
MKTATLLTKTSKACALLLCAFWAAQTSRAAQYTVEMTSDWTFYPDYLVVNVGDSVVWVNHDWTYYRHNSTCLGTWNTGLLNVDQSSAPVTFVYPGYYDYKDSNFSSYGMTGTIVVNAAPPVPATPATLLDPQMVAGVGLQFTVSNLVVGAMYVIQTSTDLVNWSDLETRTAYGPVETYMDYGTAGNERRFYRTHHFSTGN